MGKTKINSVRNEILTVIARNDDIHQPPRNQFHLKNFFLFQDLNN